MGFGCPPEQTRFKKCQSGNRKGRPKKKDDIYTLLQRVLKRKVRMKGADRKMQVREALIRKLRDLALSGDRRAIDLQRRILDEAGVNHPEAEDAEEIIQRILDGFRNMGVEIVNEGDDDA